MSAHGRALTLVLLLSFLLAACGSSGPTPTQLPAAPLLVTETVPVLTKPPVPTDTTLPSEAQPTAARLATAMPAAPVSPPAATQPAATQTPSATGSLIVFYSERDGNAEIYTMRPDGSDQRRLTTNQFEDTAPAWSPDGSQITFISDRDDPQPVACFPHCTYQLYAINADGSDERRLAETEFTTHHPDWHPDGTG